jgi:hypothetical protein
MTEHERKNDDRDDEGKPQPQNGSQQIAHKATDPGEPDVMLHVPVLKVDEIDLEVNNLRARVSLSAAVANLVSLDAGADVIVDRVKLTIRGVEAQALLRVRLEKVFAIIERTLATIEHSPDLLNNLLRPVGESVGQLARTAGETLPAIGRGVGEAVEQAVPRVGRGVGDVAEQAVPRVGRGVGEAVEQAVPSVGRAVGGAAGEALPRMGEPKQVVAPAEPVAVTAEADAASAAGADAVLDPERSDTPHDDPDPDPTARTAVRRAGHLLTRRIPSGAAAVGRTALGLPRAAYEAAGRSAGKVARRVRGESSEEATRT